MSEKLTHKGKWIKKSVLKKKEKAVAAMAQAKKNRKTKSEVMSICEGSRIVDVQELVKNLFCSNCKAAIHIKDIVGERRTGLHTIWIINCESCQVSTEVSCGKTQIAQSCSRYLADANTKAVLGAIHSGIGCSALNKLLACLDIPGIQSNVYKRYEREVGHAIEAAAKDSCKRAVEEERQLVLENMEQLCQEL